MIISNKFRLLLTIYLIGIVVISGCSSSNTNMKAGRITEETFIDWCGHGGIEDVLPDTNIEILNFLSVDTIKVDQLPEIVGGTDSLLTIIMYPEIARRAGIEGIVIVEFTIDTIGKVKNYNTIKGIGAGCDDAVIGGLIFGPKFLPAKKDNKPIDILMRIAVKFSLVKGSVPKENPVLYKFGEDFFFPFLMM